tara:strand:- start:1246 stop:2538 length:1293 start_codon:yes stop_codon:yes gene_type:complete
MNYPFTIKHRAITLFFLFNIFVGNSAFGKDEFDLRLKKYKAEKNELKKSQLLIDLATESENIHFNQIEKVAKELLESGVKMNNKQSLNTGKFVLAICLLNNGKFDKAKEYLFVSKRYFSNGENVNVLAIINNYIGHCDYKGGRYKDAIESYKKAKYLWKSLDNASEANHSNSFIATALIPMGHLEKAKQIFKECIKHLLPLKKNRALSGYYGQLGEIYSTQEKRNEASYYFEKGAEYAFKSGDPATIARAQNYLAISKYFKGEVDDALQAFKSSLQYRIQSGDVKLVCESYYNIGSLYLETEKYDLAEEYFQLSIEEAKKHDLYQDQADALLEISNIYKNKKQFDQALIHLTNYTVIKEKMLNQLQTENENDAELVELLNRSSAMQDNYSRETILINKLKNEKSKVKYILFGSILLLGGSILFLRKTKAN